MFYRIKKKKKRILKVSFRLPAEKATTTPILAQVIGQFGFNIQEFLLLFNKKSNIFLEGIKTQTFLYILQNKKWKCVFQIPIRIQSIKTISNTVTHAKHSKISFFFERKWFKNKFKYRTIHYKNWRGKITLRHLYNIQKFYKELTTIKNAYSDLKNTIHTLKSTGMYIAKTNK